MGFMLFLPFYLYIKNKKQEYKEECKYPRFQISYVNKDLSFSAFNIIITENNVNVKYKTKNNNTEDKPVFFARKNQVNANTSSIRNLMTIATMLCMV